MSAQPVKASTAKAPPKGRAGGTLRDFHEEDKLGAAYDTQLLRRLWPFLRPHGKYLAISTGLILFVAALNLVRPLVMGSLVANAEKGEPSGLLKYGVILSAVVVGTQALSFVQMYAMQIAGARAMADLRAHLFDFMQRLALRYYDRTPVGRLVTRATNDVDAVNELFASGVLNAIGDLVALIGIVIMMVVLDARMSLIAFAALPVVGAIVWFVRSRARQAYRDIRVKTARLNAFLNEQVAGMSVVQAYAREDEMASEFDSINVEYRDANKQSIFYEAVLDAAIEMVGIVCIASVLWWAGFKRIDNAAIAFPLVVTFTQYIKQFFEPVSLLAQRYTILQSAMSGAERIFKLLDEGELEKVPGPRSKALSTGGPNEAVALEDVTFSYKAGKPVLRDVSFHVNAGEKIALVGATGAGKTTVTSLLLRLYEHESGSVRVLGKDVDSYDRRELRELFSVVPQDVFLFAGTVASNVAMSADEPDLLRVEQALAKVGALDLFLRRPGGLEARVDERGANFSAGERQLIAFARALYKDAPVLILDEATASIDSDTEARLQAALEAVMAGRTALVIAHRLSTIRAVDRIVVFHRGRVVETGSHEELLAKDGVYARLYRLQFAVEAQEKQEQALADA
ncbi:ABC transporter, ATP-binding protein [Labilithrix luteola]|uniref:ABC transporter, ATP-binding protein n=1 Tax=Labilithrix luteola TaxID=1391654 RepID=A0A0K1Q1U8_9BACT|nr:ABC transporter ATP-binding protein [Labilithrix luteola]AKU99753.1 ABC transporter, ATP-binding protein [Labilithrix luteola]